MLLSSGVVLAQAADTTPPETNITNKPSTLSSTVSPSFSFASNETEASFECKLDEAIYQSCTSPKRLTLLSEGQHTFGVQATDAASNTDPTPAEYTWTVDSFDPKVTFTEKPGTYSSWNGHWVTNDKSPSWAWTVRDPNLDPDSVSCDIYDYDNSRGITFINPCSSPYTFEAELPDGNYSFWVDAEDKAGNYGYASQRFEVDTVTPKFVSGKPSGTLVSPYADVTVIFNDEVHRSGGFVNIYKRGTTTPLAVYRYAYGDEEIQISPKNSLKRGAWYTIKVTTGVNDGANNLAKPKTWSFKTRG